MQTAQQVSQNGQSPIMDKYVGKDVLVNALVDNDTVTFQARLIAYDQWGYLFSATSNTPANLRFGTRYFERWKIGYIELEGVGASQTRVA